MTSSGWKMTRFSLKENCPNDMNLSLCDLFTVHGWLSLHTFFFFVRLPVFLLLFLFLEIRHCVAMFIFCSHSSHASWPDLTYFPSKGILSHTTRILVMCSSPTRRFQRSLLLLVRSYRNAFSTDRRWKAGHRGSRVEHISERAGTSVSGGSGSFLGCRV